MYNLPSTYSPDILPKGIPVSFRQPETEDYCKRILANNGNVLSETEVRALDYWFDNTKKWRLLDKYISYFPLLGGNGSTGSMQSFQVNAIPTSPNMIFGGGVGNSSCIAGGWRNLGSTANGSTSVLNSGILHSTLNLENVGMSYYCRTEEIKSSICDMGVFAADSIVRFSLYSNYGSIYKTTSSEFGTYLISSAAASHLNIKGFFSSSKIGPNLRLSYNGNILATSTGTDKTALAGNIYFAGALRLPSTTIDVSTRTYASFAIHQGYTPDEEKIRYRIEQDFQTILGRQV